MPGRGARHVIMLPAPLNLKSRALPAQVWSSLGKSSHRARWNSPGKPVLAKGWVGNGYFRALARCGKPFFLPLRDRYYFSKIIFLPLREGKIFFRKLIFSTLREQFSSLQYINLYRSEYLYRPRFWPQNLIIWSETGYSQVLGGGESKSDVRIGRKIRHNLVLRVLSPHGECETNFSR